MKKLLIITSIASLLVVAGCNKSEKGAIQKETLTLSKDSLKDKIMGGWAGQVIGCSFGGPTEFRFLGTFIPDYQTIKWDKGSIKYWYDNFPGIYDDVYMDLTFVNVFDKYGIDAPVDSFANAFAHADYMLWHANQASRFNILNGVKAPQCGHWKKNPHADCIDFQIESDFAGLMAPGLPATASDICDKVGHIMNYGDGWYGGVYVANMYSLAFQSKDINYIVTEALKSIPQQSEFYQCINDVIQWHKKYPDDWKANWFEIQKKWTEDIGCPDGVFAPFNIDAKVNAAYIVLGLLYGNGDYTKTLEISTRAGQDSDCNPASAGGILGTVLGYSKIPAFWKQGLKEVEPINFKYTTMSLNTVYETGLKHALQVVEKNGGKVEGNNLTIKLQPVKTVQFEKSFEGLYPKEKKGVFKVLENEYTFEFEGTGFALQGNVSKVKAEDPSDYIAEVELYVDDKLIEKASLPEKFATRKHELFWNYELPNQKHTVKLKLINPDPKFKVWMQEATIYGAEKITSGFQRAEEPKKI